MEDSIYFDRWMDDIEAGEEMTHKCAECGDWYPTSYMTKRVSHTGIETHTCDMCEDTQGHEDHSDE